MADVQRAIVVNGVHTNIIDPSTGKSQNYKETLIWYDGTPMTNAKCDGNLYRRKGSVFLRKVIDKDGELFLEKDTVDQLRSMSAYEILLIQAKVVKGVKLNGYYQAGDTPAPIDYLLSTTSEVDDGGSMFEVGGIKLEHEFVGEAHGAYFGVSSTVLDNTNSIKNLFEYLNKRVVDIKIPTGVINITLDKDSTLFTFNSIENIRVFGVNSTIQDNQTYSTSTLEIATLFRIDNSNNIFFSGINFRSQIYDMTIPGGEYSGAFWFKIRNGSSNITIESDMYGGSRGVNVSSREDDGSYQERPRRVSLKGLMEYIRYPFACTFGGEGSSADIRTVFCGRSFFVYNSENIRLKIVSKNVGASILSTFNGGTLNNVEIDYEDTESDYIYPSKGEKISINFHFENNLPCTINNINIKLNCRNYSDGWGHTMTIDKFLGGGSNPDSVGRGHTLSNVKIGGYIRGENSLNSIGTVRGNFGNPDNIINFNLENLVLDGLGSNNINFNDSIVQAIKCSNVVITQNRVLALSNQNGLAEFINCEAESFTSSLNNTSRHKYVNCISRNSSIQAIDNNKEFVNTMVGIRNFNRRNYEGNLSSTISGNAFRGIGSDYVNLFKVSPAAGLFKISYYLVDNLTQPSSVRNERYGQKTFFAAITTAGVGTITSSINDIIEPSTKNTFEEDLELIFVNGDAEGAILAFRCLKLVGEDSRISVNLEVAGTNQNITLQALYVN